MENYSYLILMVQPNFTMPNPDSHN